MKLKGCLIIIGIFLMNLPSWGSENPRREFVMSGTSVRVQVPAVVIKLGPEVSEAETHPAVTLKILDKSLNGCNIQATAIGEPLAPKRIFFKFSKMICSEALFKNGVFRPAFVAPIEGIVTEETDGEAGLPAREEGTKVMHGPLGDIPYPSAKKSQASTAMGFFKTFAWFPNHVNPTDMMPECPEGWTAEFVTGVKPLEAKPIWNCVSPVRKSPNE